MQTQPRDRTKSDHSGAFLYVGMRITRPRGAEEIFAPWGYFQRRTKTSTEAGWRAEAILQTSRPRLNTAYPVAK